MDLTTHTSLSPIRRGFAPGFVNYKKGCTRLAATSDKVDQLLAHGRWFSPASSTTKTGRHDIAEIWLKVALKQLDLQLPVQSVPITTKVVSSNPWRGVLESIQHYVIKFVNELRQVGGFLWVLEFPTSIKLTATI